MRRDLEHAIDGGVADRLACQDMLGTKFVDDGGARRVPVADNAGESALADDRRGQIDRKSRDGLREIAPGERNRRAGYLPMAGGRILADRNLDRRSVESCGRGVFQTRRNAARCAGAGMAKAKAREVR